MAGFFDLKDEAQAKEYLDRVGVEYRFQCFSEGETRVILQFGGINS